MILADVFETFRDTSLSSDVYELDPAHYVSAPQLSWDAMLKCTAVELDLISDPAMFHMIDSGIRGGMCMIVKRMSRANNKYMGPAYDPSKPSKYILDLDANNLYGWAMSQPLPTGGFEFVEPRLFDDYKWTDWLDLGKEIGYVVECDLEYPEHLHDAHNDYPLAPERMDIKEDMFSEKQEELTLCYTKPRGGNSTKLVTTLLPKKKVVLHNLMLKFYLDHGMKLTKIYRVIQFKQSPWLAPYIQKNSLLRKNAKNDFERDFFKLMNNAIYGKTCENLKKRTDIRLVNDRKDAKLLIERAQCLNFRIFNEEKGLVGVESRKTKIMIDKPFYVGFSVLELSKLHMYRFHYDVIKKDYGARAELLFTDTDSLMYEIETEDVYDDMLKRADLYDLAEYPKDHKCYDPTNNKVIGKFKDETKGEPIVEFIGLRPKMYSFVTSKIVNGEPELHEKHTAKGIQSSAAARLRHENYRQQLEMPYENTLTNRRIGARSHQLYSMEFEKRGLCAMDNKRYIVDDNIHTLAYGHSRIPVRINLVDPLDDDEENVFSIEEAIREGLINRGTYAGAGLLNKDGCDPGTVFNNMRKTLTEFDHLCNRSGVPSAQANAAENPLLDDHSKEFEEFLALMND